MEETANKALPQVDRQLSLHRLLHHHFLFKDQGLCLGVRGLLNNHFCPQVPYSPYLDKVAELNLNFS